jgi:hypothetical protein
MPRARGIKLELRVTPVLLPQTNSTRRTNESSCAWWQRLKSKTHEQNLAGTTHVQTARISLVPTHSPTNQKAVSTKNLGGAWETHEEQKTDSSAGHRGTEPKGDGKHDTGDEDREPKRRPGNRSESGKMRISEVATATKSNGNTWAESKLGWQLIVERIKTGGGD